MKTLEWLVSMELPPGGLACWPGGEAYSEITGYCIPTLLAYNELVLAGRLSDWLLNCQNADGSFNDMSGAARSFDTAACMEGLEAAYSAFHKVEYVQAATKARNWLKTMRRMDGALRTSPHHDRTHLYTMRASGLIDDKKAAAYWKSADWGDPLRAHYAAYALEGLWKVGEKDFVAGCLRFSQRIITQHGLMPYWITGDWKGRQGTDTCATAQFAVLYKLVGLDISHLLEGLEKMILPDGALLHGVGETSTPSWAAKFYLDLARLL